MPTGPAGRPSKDMEVEMNEETDRALAERLLQGDRTAFRELVETYKKRIYGLAFEITRNRSDAEDVSQEVFMKVCRSIGTFQRDARLSSWLYRIAVNAAIDHARKKPFFPPEVRETPAGAALGLSDQDPISISAGPEQEAEARLLRARIERALERVSEREKNVFLLRHYHDLKLKEIAEVLSISEGSVKSYLFRVIKKLQKELRAQGFRLKLETNHE